MKIRWNRQNKIPLLLLLFYALGAAQLTDRYRRVDCSLPADLVAGVKRVGDGLNRVSNALSRLRIGSWLGNSWAPGSIGWTTASTASAAGPEEPQAAAPVLAEHAAAIDLQVLELPAALPMIVSPAQQASQGVRLIGCGPRPLVVLTRTEVVVVTAEFQRVETPQGSLSPPPAPLVEKTALKRPARGGCRSKSST